MGQQLVEVYGFDVFHLEGFGRGYVFGVGGVPYARYPFHYWFDTKQVVFAGGSGGGDLGVVAGHFLLNLMELLLQILIHLPPGRPLPIAEPYISCCLASVFYSSDIYFCDTIPFGDFCAFVAEDWMIGLLFF